MSFNGQRFVRSHPRDSWWIDPPVFQVRNAADSMPIFGRQPSSIVSKGMYEAYGSLTSSEVPWIQAIGKDRFFRIVLKVYKEIDSWLQEEPVARYIETHLKEREVLSILEPAKIDIREFEKRKNSPSVDSFSPGVNGFSRNVRYSHATSTGRLKVTDGPKILTLAKQDRRVISSRFSDGRILQVDFVSLEPRVALYSVGQNPGGDDVYEWISRSIGSGLTRSKVKVPTLSVLYGQSHRNDDSVSSSIREKITSLFKIELLKERACSGGFKNGYGRPLEEVEDRLLISHFVQSTAVDVALLGFRKILKDMSSHVGGGIVPLFILHDALILDVSPDLYGFLKGVIDKGVEVDPLGHFPLSLGPIWDE